MRAEAADESQADESHVAAAESQMSVAAAESQMSVAAAETGKAAVANKRRARRDGNADAVEKPAKSLKGSYTPLTAEEVAGWSSPSPAHGARRVRDRHNFFVKFYRNGRSVFDADMTFKMCVTAVPANKDH